MVAGKNRVGSKRKKGRERLESGLTEWETECRREPKNGVGQEMTIGNDT
jgi:hypothetical protein